MKKRRKIRFGIIMMLCCTLCMAMVVLAEPGTEDDPLISESYIKNKVIPYLEQYIDSKVGNSSEGGASSSFNVVEVSKGQKVICAAGTELILRMGEATIIATQKGGIADTTAGWDLSNGADMPSNHLLIVPLADGRGLQAKNDVLVMIKGGYTVE